MRVNRTRFGRDRLQDIINTLDLEWAKQPAQSPRLQPNERWSAVTANEVAVCVHGVFSLSMGIERGDTCE